MEPGDDIDLDGQLEANRRNWDERVPIHVRSAFYDTAGFRAGRDSLAPHEPLEVGDVDGLDLVHLQCHLGHDTISWARRGAHVTGVDFSQPAVDAARELAADVGVDARFERIDVYEAPDVLSATYDVVYTSHGVLTWLPDVGRWAETVAALLRPGGFLYLSEFHPITWGLGDDDLTFQHDYFHGPGPVRWEEPGTYADEDAVTEHDVTYEWNHGLGAVVTALVSQGLRLEFLHEHPFTLFERWPGLERHDDGTYHLPEGRPNLPLIYSLKAVEPRS